MSYADCSISNGEEREGGTRHIKKAFIDALVLTF